MTTTKTTAEVVSGERVRAGDSIRIWGYGWVTVERVEPYIGALAHEMCGIARFLGGRGLSLARSGSYERAEVSR